MKKFLICISVWTIVLSSSAALRASDIEKSLRTHFPDLEFKSVAPSHSNLKFDTDKIIFLKVFPA